MSTLNENARDEFQDAPTRDQAPAVLILSRQRYDCRLTEVSTQGFTVMIPHGLTWSWEPTAKLLTHDSKYNVKILNQVAQYDGIEVTLQRLDEIANEDKLPFSQRWIIHGSRCCAIGLIAAITYCVIAAPGGITNTVHQVTIQEYAAYLADYLPSGMSWSGSSSHESIVMPAITVALDEVEEADSSPINSVSHSRETPSNVPRDRTALLNAAIRAANAQRSRPVNATTVPWLIPKDQTGLPRCHMSRLAEADLQTFQAGLKSLSATMAADAVASLRKALLSVSPTAGAAVAGCPGVRLIHSDDAEIYVRTVDGEVELLRVLPIELEDPAPRGPSAAVPRPSRHR